LEDKRTTKSANPSAPIYDGVDAPDGIDVPKWRC
jgi:hypothetical protein